MSLNDIFSNSIKYPFSDLTAFLFVGIMTLLVSLPTIIASFGIDNNVVLIISVIIAIIFAILLSGYSISVIKRGIENSDDIPEIDLKNNFIDGIKAIVISIVYYIIPLIIVLIIALITGAIGAGIDQMVAALGIFAILAIIVFIIFAIFEIIALARFANTNSLGEALSIGEVYGDVKRIGVFNIIAFIIIAFIIMAIAYVIGAIIGLIPYVGIIITSIVVMAFVALFYNKALGLLYSDMD